MGKGLLGIAIIVVVGFAWRVVERLSDDALGLAVGLVFGVLATLPVAFLMLAASRRKETTTRAEPMYPQYPPVIMMGGQQSTPSSPSLPQLPLFNRKNSQAQDLDQEW